MLDIAAEVFNTVFVDVTIAVSVILLAAFFASAAFSFLRSVV